MNDPKIKRVIMSCFAGNWLEWYEFAIFGFLMKPISHAFFPDSDAFLSTIMTYGVFATGFIMRPFGALISGYLGDRKGRKIALLFSITLMALPTFCIGILPSYAHIGIFAPILLMICRLLQGISLGGEFSGSVVYLIEHAPQHRRGFFGVWADLGSIFGMISAILTTMLLNITLSHDQMFSWGWRLPFLFGILFGFIGYYLRRNLHETPSFRDLPAHKKTENPLKTAILSDPLTFLLSTLFLAVNSAAYYFLIIYLPQQVGEMHSANGWESQLSSILPLISIIFMIPSCYLGATLSDRIGQAPCLIGGYMALLLSIFPIIYVTLYMGPLWQCGMHGLFSFILGMCFGPRSSFMVQFFPVEIRYTAVSMTYNLANAVFGGLSPLICITLVEWTGNKMSSGIWITAMAVISLISVIGLDRIDKNKQIKVQEDFKKAA